jgi:hypothetical protein
VIYMLSDTEKARLEELQAKASLTPEEEAEKAALLKKRDEMSA